MTEDERFMARTLQLALTPQRTYPNPRVGAVVVRDGVVIGEGWHAGAGTDHAEAVALRDVDASSATLYVNLEPCDHEGRRPACVPSIARAGVKRVVVAHEDPDPRVQGRGILHLRESGIEVSVGVLEEEARALNAPYLHQRRSGRPWLTLKLALSADGRAAASDGSSRWVTGPSAREWVHRRRAEADAVLVGAGTVIADDPSLSSRTGRDGIVQPLRIVVDGGGAVPATAAVFDGVAPVVMATTPETHDAQRRWKEAGAEVVVVPEHAGHVDLHALMETLGRRGLVEVYCEGGPRLGTALLKAGLPNRMEFFYAPMLLGRGGADIGSLGVTTISSAERFTTVAVHRFDDDVLMIMERKD